MCINPARALGPAVVTGCGPVEDARLQVFGFAVHACKHKACSRLYHRCDLHHCSDCEGITVWLTNRNLFLLGGLWPLPRSCSSAVARDHLADSCSIFAKVLAAPLDLVDCAVHWRHLRWPDLRQAILQDVRSWLSLKLSLKPIPARCIVLPAVWPAWLSNRPLELTCKSLLLWICLPFRIFRVLPWLDLCTIGACTMDLLQHTNESVCEEVPLQLIYP